MQVQISIKNLAKFEAAMRGSPIVMARHLQRAINKAAMFYTAKTKDHIRQGTDMWKPPIDTGQMFNSIFPTISSLRAEIKVGSGNPLKYAPYVHEGTQRMAARPFFEITAEHENAEIDKIFEEELNSAMKELAI